ncbi:MAG: chemotaxis protein CheB [Deltaproteobacteria bacterium]|nr:MAG: chemotaxis protein CheB [Deltaproteobacteria bacterium]
MPTRDLFVIGASAGGVEALSQLVSHLPHDLAAAVLVVLHIPQDRPSVLPRILSAAGALPATHAKGGERAVHGHLYVAPPGRHLLVHDGTLRLSSGPKEGGHRPAIDPLFRTAARAAGSRVVGVVLSGSLDDGTAGLVSIKQLGGICVVQDPNEAICGDMPRNALQNADVDHCLKVASIAELLVRLSREQVADTKRPHNQLLEREARIALDDGSQDVTPAPGEPSQFSCPACGGVLNEIHDGDLLRFRCRVGHAYGPDALRMEQQSALEGALWAALRALEEQASLARRLAVRSRELKQGKTAGRFDDRATAAERQAAIVRQALRHGLSSSVESEEDGPGTAPAKPATAHRSKSQA